MSDTSYYDEILFHEKLRAAETESDYKLFAMLRPKLSIDGNQWCCLFGDNLQSGIAGFGETPIAAIRDWNSQWYKSAAERGEGL